MKNQVWLCPACGLPGIKNGTRLSVRKGKYQQYLCVPCKKCWWVPLNNSPSPTLGLKWRVAQSIALYAIGFTRAEIERRTGVASETLRKTLDWYANHEQWFELMQFILFSFRTVRKSEMVDLKTDVFARLDGLVSLRERALNAKLKAKMRSKEEFKDFMLRGEIILSAKKYCRKISKHKS